MKVYFAGGEDSHHFNTIKKTNKDFNVLSAFRPNTKMMDHLNTVATGSYFLDSGAFGAFTQGKKIPIDTYCDFIKKTEKKWTVYANLDVIGDWKGTAANLAYMEAKGLRPLPVFHYQSPLEELERLVTTYDYIALGGLVPLAGKRKMMVWWLDTCFRVIKNRCKIHGFGVNSIEMWKRYPFYSVDSTSWFKFSRRIAKLFLFEGTKIKGIAGFGKHGENRSDIMKYKHLIPDYKNTEEADKSVNREIRTLLEYSKAADFSTKLWATRGVNWE